MVSVAGTITLQEWRGRQAVHIFTLCDVGTGTYEPVSQLGHQQVRGVELQRDGRRLSISLARLAENFRGALIGIYVATTQSLTWEDYRLKLTYQNGKGRVVHDSYQQFAQRGDRFVILAKLSMMSGQWNVAPVSPPETFKDKYALNDAHPVPMWWRQHV